MSLRTKMLTILLIIWSVILAAMIIGSYAVILSDYETIEQNDIAENYTRTQEAIARMRDSLDKLAIDWAHWNDSYQFLQDKNKEYISENLTGPVSFKDMRVNFILYFDDNRQYFYGKAFDLEKNEFIPVYPSLLSYITEHPELLNHENATDNSSGFIKVPEGFVLLASYPVTDGLVEKKPNGNIIMGYFFDDNRLQGLGKTLNAKIDLFSLDEALNNPELKLVNEQLSDNKQFYSVPVNDKLIYAYQFLHNIDNKPIGIFRFDLMRTTYQKGLNTIHRYIVMMSFIALIILIVITFSLRHFVLKRISLFRNKLKEITSKNDFSQQIPITGKDEISSMIESSNEMLTVINKTENALNDTISTLVNTNEQLQDEIQKHIESKKKIQELNEQLISSARRAGMAEVATSVLHNVGNVLNSLNTSATILKENLQRTKLLNSFAELNHAIRDPHQSVGKFLQGSEQGQQLGKYLELLENLLKDDQMNSSKELNSLLSNVQHIKEVIMTQQSLSGISGTLETISIPEQINAAVDIVGFNSAYIIERHYAINTPIIVNKIKLMQILVNMIRNAKDALKDSEQHEKKLIISADLIPDDKLQIKVTDNGIGIAPENIDKIFTFGFTTKKDGHGFGLHHSAILATEMGGSLKVESGGLGKGATFILEVAIKYAKNS